MNDIDQRLALLPEGWAEENTQSWQDAIQYYQGLVLDYPNSRFKYLLGLVQTILKSEQAKLFKTYPSVWTLIISTSSMKEEPRFGDLFLVLGVMNEYLTRIVYVRTTGAPESVDCKSEEIMPTLQSLLDRLWNETRGRKDS